MARLPTPLEPLDRLRAEIGGPRIWVKRDDITEGLAGGNKLRKLEFTVGQALADGADVLITAGAKQSNHCRQTAFAALRHGLGCHLVLAGRPPTDALDGNLLLDELLGAEITYVTGEEFEELPTIFEALSENYRREGSQPFCIPLGASDEIGLWGYIECAGELQKDFAAHGIEPSHIVSATGSGGTLAGLMLGAQRYGLDAEVLGIAVSRDREFFEAKTDELFERWSARYGEPVAPDLSPLALLDRYVAPGYGKAGPNVFRTIGLVARLEGIVFDPVYTGKAFDGLLQEIEAGRFDDDGDVVFLHTGGIYSVFTHRERFTEPSS